MVSRKTMPEQSGNYIYICCCFLVKTIQNYLFGLVQKIMRIHKSRVCFYYMYPMMAKVFCKDSVFLQDTSSIIFVNRQRQIFENSKYSIAIPLSKPQNCFTTTTKKEKKNSILSNQEKNVVFVVVKPFTYLVVLIKFTQWVNRKKVDKQF